MDVSEPVAQSPSCAAGSPTWVDGAVPPQRENYVKIALSLYKVQQSIYLLDFQHVEVSESAY